MRVIIYKPKNKRSLSKLSKSQILKDGKNNPIFFIVENRRADNLGIKSNKIWRQDSIVDEKMIEEMAEELNRSPLFVEICFQRGLKTIDEIESFLAIDESWFHDPFLMKDMNKAIERIVKAVEKNEQITIYGDYDADGISSTALLYETLDSIGAKVNYYLPNRFIEGYGPDVAAFDQIIQNGTSLIITVDNGVSGHDAVTFSQEKNVDVIVTDHHALPEVLPEAYAIIHPAHPEGDYPFSDLAGVGVALKVATALMGELPVELLDLAAIGTVADLVSLKDENRAIVYFGLKMMENTQRVGLQELFQVIAIEAQEVDEDTIGFQIAPRLNAIGRLGDASPGVELLTTHDLSLARELAEFTDDKNIERKSIVEEMTEEAFEKLKEKNDDSEIVLLADEGWHQGVLGIVASRIVEKTNKATLLFTIDPETKIAKGSARSVAGVNLYESFTAIEELFISFGGHEMAAGMTAESEQLPSIEKKLSDYIKTLEYDDRVKRVDAFASLKELSLETIRELEKLKPYGMDNTKPLIASMGVSIIKNQTVGLDGSHLKLQVEQDEEVLDIISFRNGEMSDYLFEQQKVSVAGYVELNEWNGRTKVQMQMIDIDIPGPKLVDERMNRLSEKYFKEENVQYLFYNQASYQTVKDFVPESSEVILIETLTEAEEFYSQEKIVIVDCPKSIEQFNATIRENTAIPIHCYFYKKDHQYLTGLPSREDFTKFYKFIKKHKEIDLKKNGHHMINHLEIESNKMFLIVQVFLEAKFVIMEHGLLKIRNNPEEIELEQTKSYQDAVEQFEAEELFLYSSFKEIMDSFNK